jgi:hypothetical protein
MEEPRAAFDGAVLRRRVVVFFGVRVSPDAFGVGGFFAIGGEGFVVLGVDDFAEFDDAGVRVSV